MIKTATVEKATFQWAAFDDKILDQLDEIRKRGEKELVPKL